MIHQYWLKLDQALQSCANEAEASRMSAYMRNKYQFYGVRAPVCRVLLKDHIKQYGLPQDFAHLDTLVRNAWAQNQREWQYLAMNMVDMAISKWSICDMEHLFAHMITNDSWWDTVDFISSTLVHKWWKMDHQLVDNVNIGWNKHANFWLNRTSIIYQLKRRHQTRTDLLSSHIVAHSASSEFFIQKAIGWALREYAKHNSQWVMAFVAKTPLKPLSKREALKQIKAGKIKKPW